MKTKQLPNQSPEIILSEETMSLCLKWEANGYYEKSLSEYLESNANGKKLIEQQMKAGIRR